MAVIKIVPMPGAKGDQGDQGPSGAQGPQGETGAQGPAGADALWHYNGPWQSNATYAEGDVVTHLGQTFYATGVTTLGIFPALDSNFDLIAAKGEDWTSQTSNGSWDPDFFNLSSIETSQYQVLADYTTIADLVHFETRINLEGVTNWNTGVAAAGAGPAGWWKIKLPFLSKNAYSGQGGFMSNEVFTGMLYDGSFRENHDPEQHPEDIQWRTFVGRLISQTESPHIEPTSFLYFYAPALHNTDGFAEGELKKLTSDWPTNFTQQNQNLGAGSSIQISGVYRRAII